MLRSFELLDSGVDSFGVDELSVVLHLLGELGDDAQRDRGRKEAKWAIKGLARVRPRARAPTEPLRPTAASRDGREERR